MSEALVDELISKLQLNSSGNKCLRQNKANLGSLSATEPASGNTRHTLLPDGSHTQKSQ